MGTRIKTKADLFKYLIFIPTSEVRDEINRIISKNRDIEISCAKFKKLIRPNEVAEVLEFFGIEEDAKTEQKQ